MFACGNQHPRYTYGDFPLSPHQIDELDAFLGWWTTPAIAAVDSLHGFLTAIALSPVENDPEQWLPFLRGESEKGIPRSFSPSQDRRLISLVFQIYNDLMAVLNEPSRVISPLVSLARDDRGTIYADGGKWSSGFLIGISLLEEDWEALLNLLPGWVMLPAVALGCPLGASPWTRPGVATSAQNRAHLTDCIQLMLEVIRLQRFGIELDALKEARRLLARTR